MAKSYSKADQQYFDTINEAGKLNNKINYYRFRELDIVKNEFEYKIYLNRLHRDIRDEMSKLSLNEAKELAKFHIQKFKDLQTTISCMKTIRGSLYGNYKGGF